MRVVSARSGPRPQPAADALVAELFHEHGRVLLAYARQLTSGDTQRAEDAVQETLLRAWRHSAAFTDGSGSARGWLMTVLRHIIIDEARARNTRPHEVGGDRIELATDAHDDIEDALRSWTILEALTSLSAEHRAVIVETYYRGSSVAEAASRLGIPPGTVKSRAYYALRALRLALSERGVT
ncbi:MAG: sigma-70 family RNA polymerase sigma factor [Nocardioidaceae bacterium]